MIRRFGVNSVIYISYIVAVTALCMVFVQFAPGSGIRRWYYKLTHKATINKACERQVEEDKPVAGTFLTKYRYRQFGATDPNVVDPNAPMIAFTFDDGPTNESTERILAALEANYSKATFFVVGRQTQQFPEKLKKILAAGCEIGNHTYDHKNLVDLSTDDISEQIASLDRSVNSATGEDTTLIRPPYGSYDEKVMSVLDKPVILWDVDSEDWKSRNAQTICNKVLAEVKDGDIILMHDLYESTAEAVELLLPKLKEQGYQIVTISDMARYKGKALELGKPYGKISDENQ